MDDALSPFELVIFDCDGVLVDSERLTIDVEARVLTDMGWEISAEEVVERFMGRSNESVNADVAEQLGADRAAEFDRAVSAEVRTAFRDHLVPVDGVRDLIDQLGDAGVAMCVASSGSHHKMEYTLGVTGLYDRFAGQIYSASEVANGKPAPDLFLYAARSMGVEPERSIVIEDSVTGVRGARAAQMRCWGFAGGLTPSVKLEEAGAMVFDHMSELAPKLIGD